MQDTSTTQAPLLTAREVAALLSLPVSCVYTLTRQNRIPHIPVGRWRRYNPASIEAWRDELEVRPGGQS